MKQAPFTSKRWRRVEYQRLVDVGAFEGEPIELIGGHLMVAEPKGSEHSAAVDMAYVALLSAIPAGWTVRGQNPLALDDESAPEPDLAIVRGSPADFRHAHPTRPALVIEVAESSLQFDRVTKGSLYARAGIADYWIVNRRSRRGGLSRPDRRSHGAVRLAIRVRGALPCSRHRDAAAPPTTPAPPRIPPRCP